MEFERSITPEKQKMGWLCSYTPLELIYSAGFVPYRIMGHSYPVKSADSYIHPNYCQFVKSAIDIAVEGGYEFLEGVIFMNSCDAMRRCHDVWKKFKPQKFISFIDIPMGDSLLGVKYLTNEFLKLKTALEEHTKKTISHETLKESIDLFLESRSLYQQLNSLRLSNPPLIKGEEMMRLTSDFFKSSPTVWNANIKILLEEKRQSTTLNHIPRVILSGSPIHDVEFISFIESCGMNVIYEDVCTGSKFFDINIVKSDDLINSLGEAYLNRPPCARMMKIKERVSHIYEISQKFKIDGIIHHSLKFCDVYLYDVPIIKDMLNEKEIKVVFIESDGIGSPNQLRTRLEAFSEMIKN